MKFTWRQGQYNTHSLSTENFGGLTLSWGMGGYILHFNAYRVPDFPVTQDLETAKRLAENWLKSKAFDLAKGLGASDFTWQY